MMRESQTAILERGVRVDDQLTTEPFEVAWAGEARWFVQNLDSANVSTEQLTLAVQVSPDGLAWVDHEDQPRTVPVAGMSTIAVRDLGHWLRLVVRRSGTGAGPLLRIFLALKE